MEFNQYLQAKTNEEAFEAIKNGGTIVGGGAWVKLLKKSTGVAIGLDLLGLDDIEVTESTIKIGAMTTLRDIEKSIKIKAMADGILSETCNHIMGVGLRNIATIGGSVAGKFGFSDILPVLLVLDAQVELHYSGKISIEEYLNGKYQKDLILSIEIPKKEKRGFVKSVKKVATDFPVIVVAITYGETVNIAVGSRPGVAQLATDAMDYLNSENDINEETINKAGKLIRDTMSFGTNVRSSADYRRDLACTYVKRGLKEVANERNA